MCAFVKDDVKLGVIGCGKMASAILGGIASHKFISSEDICVYDILDDFQKDIHFNTSISIAKVLQCVVGKCADEYFLTEKGSSIVLRNALSSSTDVTRIILFCA